MKHLLFAILLTGSFYTTSCRKPDDAKTEFIIAGQHLTEGYQSSSPAEAKKALIEYRKTLIKTDGFKGYSDITNELFLVDARLMILCDMSGDTNEAARWYVSYLYYLNLFRSRDGRTNCQPTVDEVKHSFAKVEKGLNLRWKKGLDKQQ